MTGTWKMGVGIGLVLSIRRRGASTLPGHALFAIEHENRSACKRSQALCLRRGRGRAAGAPLGRALFGRRVRARSGGVVVRRKSPRRHNGGGRSDGRGWGRATGGGRSTKRGQKRQGRGEGGAEARQVLGSRGGGGAVADQPLHQLTFPRQRHHSERQCRASRGLGTAEGRGSQRPPENHPFLCGKVVTALAHSHKPSKHQSYTSMTSSPTCLEAQSWPPTPRKSDAAGHAISVCRGNSNTECLHTSLWRPATM